MKSPQIFLLLAMLVASAIALTDATAPQSEEGSFNGIGTGDDNTTTSVDRRDLLTSLRGRRGFFPRSAMKCDKYPRVCRARGSPGPDCCKKRCVNVMKDRFNCGKCGRKCKYWQTCCRGRCVNVMSNEKHCGGCNNKCKKGSSCTYGMCSYA